MVKTSIRFFLYEPFINTTAAEVSAPKSAAPKILLLDLLNSPWMYPGNAKASFKPFRACHLYLEPEQLSGE